MRIATILLVAATAALSEPVAFVSYPAEAPLRGQPAKPQMHLPKARRFQSVLRTEASEGPNFNGHYRVARWGCGTNCIEWAVIDLLDGQVWFAPEPASSCWAPGEPEGLEWPEWIEARLDSRLLFLHQCRPGGEGERTFNLREAYEWRDGRAKLVRTDPFWANNDTRR